ncbi:LpqB family beta-propeller domain-containing protein [uncultured Demequina sp.]|uniref:LpqB family beta-propeller domain-containing protein n=1 Tax=uncultured Demequina sp. TaxID=693499 RepID=UPI0025F7B225|nr:LpqB family beta-propeller domain-containing protein [uncultured Demequina sp.]
MRAPAWISVAVAAVLVLGACASIPDSGPVEEGNADVSPVEPLVPIQEGPDPSDGPEAIVTGFLTAAAGGIATDFSVAREFLTTDAARSWDPGAQTVVYDSGAAAPEWDAETRTVSYELPLATLVDESGRRVDATDGQVASIAFTVAQVDGEWRISELDDGVVISAANFNRFYRSVALVFTATDREVVVPELRWLPDNNVATSAARELLEGPSTWLADAVVTGFPATAALAVESVVVADGTATVDLTPQSAGTPEERALANEQLRLTLTALPAVSEVDVRIGGLPISAASAIELEAPPVPDEVASAFVAGRLGVWDGEALWVTPASAGGVTDGAGLARSYDGSTSAWIQAGGALVASDVLGGDVVLVEADGELEDTAEAVASETLYSGRSLVAPTYDRHGYVWTAERSGSGGLVAVAPDGTAVPLPAEWLQARAITGVSMSRDGARLAVTSRAGGQPVLEVVGVVRDQSGAPTGLGEPVVIGTGVGVGLDVVWIDTTTVGVLGEPEEGSQSRLWSVQVGGGTTVALSVSNAADLTVRSGETSLVVIDAEGQALERSGTSWAPLTAGATELAYAG